MLNPRDNKKPTIFWYLAIIVVCILLFAFFGLMLSNLWPWGSDYYYHFYPLAKQWLNGGFQIFDGPGERLFYPPWSLFVIIPLGLFPIEYGHGFLLAGTFILLLFSIIMFYSEEKIPLWIVFLALTNLHSFDLYIRGQIDAIILLGLALSTYAVINRSPLTLSLGMCLLLMKPPLNVLIVVVLIGVYIRGWTTRELVLVATLPVFMIITSSFMVGLDWPIIFIRNVEFPVDYLSISLWKYFDSMGLPISPLAYAFFAIIFTLVVKAWKKDNFAYLINLGLAVNFIFTLYANGDHYVLLIPALVFVFQHNQILGWLSYLLTFSPLLRLSGNADLAIIDIAYPVSLFISLIFIEISRSHDDKYIKV